MKSLHKKRGHKCFRNGVNDCAKRKEALDKVLGNGGTYKYVLDYGKMPTWKYIRDCEKNISQKPTTYTTKIIKYYDQDKPIKIGRPSSLETDVYNIV
jgi:hypothetical protein